MPDEKTWSRLSDLGLIATSIAHEMRQPLLGVKAFAQLIRESPADAVDLADQILQQAIVLETLLDRVRTYGRAASAGQIECRAEVGTAMASVEALLRGMARTSFVKIESTLPPDLPAVALDATSLQQILLNLVRNAIECPRKSPGRVWASATTGDGRVVITVEDDGPGIAAEVRATLFAPMKTTKAQGLGLGLYVSRKIAEERGGRLEEDSESGKGARFRLVLPAHT